jgi:hypothetical protein
MNSKSADERGAAANPEQNSLTFLRATHIAIIDEALSAVGDFGEVHLVVEHGRLRYVVTQRSADVLKWQPGSLAGRPGHAGRDTTSVPR